MKMSQELPLDISNNSQTVTNLLSIANIQRNASETCLEMNNGTVVKKPPKIWERSQSAFDLDSHKDKPRYTSTSVLECGEGGTLGNKVSEHSSVYWDLSKADDEARHGGKFKISLQTIHQKEEMTSTTSTSSPTVSIQARLVRRMSSETSVIPGSSKTEYSEFSLPAPEFALPGSPQVAVPSSPGRNIDDLGLVYSSPSHAKSHRKFTFTYNQSNNATSNLTVTLANAVPAMKENIRLLGANSVSEKTFALHEILYMIEQAWAMPTIGRDLAYSLCDVLRKDGGLEILIKNCDDLDTHRDVLLGSARVLAQSMTVVNRDFVARKGLEIIVKLADKNRDDLELSQAATGILESLFKHSQNTCSMLIKFGGLDTILYSCRTFDTSILRHCAVALANLAIYGGEENQHEMIEHKAPEWLFPLAFSNDDSIRYYAFLAIAALSANKELELAVVKSGTLGLVEPFIRQHDPIKFGKSDYAHMHGQSKDWLSHLVPLLRSKREEAQSLAAFHFAMEAGIRQEQGKIEIFQEIGTIEPLKCLASGTNKLAAKFASQALRLIGEEVPHKLSPQVPLWTPEDISHWLHRTGLDEEIIKTLEEFHFDGDLLLLLTEENLKEDFNVKHGVTRRRILRELTQLKQKADYEACDPTRLDEWLSAIGKEFRQYTYQMLKSGVDKSILRFLNEDHLEKDCGILNGVHRMKILEGAKRLSSIDCSPVAVSDYPAGMFDRCIDAFISYRRSTGSQLASLLKVHLQLRGYVVFLDIEKLRAGKFDDNLLNSVRNARNFILVLTPNALDRCMGDFEQKDWIHREVVAALEGGCNVIPIVDTFQWPSPESLPEDMRPIIYFNSIRWIHDYQDACVDKLEQFINGEKSTRPVGGLRGALSKGNSLCSPTPDLYGTSVNTPPVLCDNSPNYNFTTKTNSSSRLPLGTENASCSAASNSNSKFEST